VTGPPNLSTLRQYVDTTMTAKGGLGHVERVMDPETLEYVNTFVADWTGKMLIYPSNLAGNEVVVGGTEYAVTRYTVLLDEDAPVTIGATLKVTESRDAPALTELTFTIVDAPVTAWSVARQCVAEVVTPT
jgi:hypothetical protein